MRIAAIADVHGNLPAMEAVLANIDSERIDQVIFCGDFVLGAPDDRDCYYRALETGAPLIRGNTDRFVAEFGTDHADPRWTTEQFGPLQYAVSQFSDSERKELGALQTSYRLPEVPEILFYHANPLNDRDIIRPWSLEEDLDRNFNGVEGEVFVGGHNHTQFICEYRGHQIVTCGSVGATNEYAAGAQYVVIENMEEKWRIEHRDVPYDIELTLKRYTETNYIKKTGPMGRLFVRGVATSTNQIMPFLDWYGSTSQEMGFSEAIDTFLNLY